MIRPVQVLLLMLIGLAGIASLIATSPPPGPLFYLVSENNFEDNDESGYYRYGPESAFACKDEEATLKWGVREGGNPRLSAEPIENISPELKRKPVSREGSLNISILGDAELKLDVNRDLPDGYLQVGLVPEELCTGYAFPIVGWYEGAFEQITPLPASLERQLRLVWMTEGAEPFLRAELADKLLTPNFLDRFRCDYKLAGTGLACNLNEGDKTLTLEFDITENGLAGTYSGVAASGTSITGKFTVTKQTGAPPQEPSPQEIP